MAKFWSLDEKQKRKKIYQKPREEINKKKTFDISFWVENDPNLKKSWLSSQSFEMFFFFFSPAPSSFEISNRVDKTKAEENALKIPQIISGRWMSDRDRETISFTFNFEIRTFNIFLSALHSLASFPISIFFARKRVLSSFTLQFYAQDQMAAGTDERELRLWTAVPCKF